MTHSKAMQRALAAVTAMNAAAQYRSTAADIRQMAVEAATPETRDELQTLAEHFERLAALAEVTLEQLS